MKNAMRKLYISFSIFLGTMLSLAQVVPPPPPEPESGDIGGPLTPIDNYIVLLLLIATAMIYYYRYNLKLKKN